ncbi:uncharacterized protein [Typha latifolia]|uniref:uncharacterized protein isoform X2 n=1 Tax=Typha latifolia TaxID=4733 RepID=UPI003C2CD712
MKVLVTGATGFLGGRLCTALLSDGHEVRALVRRSSDLSNLPLDSSPNPVEIAYGDVTDLSSLLLACDGCEMLFHAAAAVEPWLPDPSRFFAMHQGKVFCTEYEKSKVLADKIALQAATNGVPIVLVYPGVIYGPGKLTAGNVLARILIERFNGRLPGHIGDGNDRTSFSHIEDVVAGHIAAMHKGRVGERYLLTGENASFTQIFDMAAVITKTKRPMFHIPLWVIEIYGWISVFFSRITGKLPLISYPTVRVMSHQWSYSCDKAKNELGYSPRSLNEGLTEILSWLKSLKLIDY